MTRTEAEDARGLELMCERCGCTRWACLTKCDGECCGHCEHPPTPKPKPWAHPDTMIGRT